MPETSSPPRDRRRTSPLAIAVALALAATCMFFGARHVIGRVTLARVTVTPSAMTCDDKPVPLALGAATDQDGHQTAFGGTEDDPPTPELTPTLTETTTCLLSVAIANPGSRPVTMTSLSLPGMAPGDPGSSAFEADSRDDGTRPTTPAETSDDFGDAVFDVDETIGAGTWTELSFNLRYRLDYVSCSTSLIGQSELPIVRVTSAGASRDVVGDVRLTFHPPRTDANRDSCG